MKTLHAAIDLDDVCLDLVGGVCGVIRKEYGVDLQPEAITDWNFDYWLEPILDQKWMKWMRRRDWLWSTFPAVPGAIGGIDTLRRRGVYLELVTSKPEWAENQVWKWLGLWRPAFNRVTIVGPYERKVDFTDADVLVDDKPQNVQEFLEEGRRAILFSRPHNMRIWNLPLRPVHPTVENPLAQPRVVRVTRADDWRSVVDLLSPKESNAGG